MAFTLQTPPATPIKQLLSDKVHDDKEANLVHVRVPGRVLDSSGGPDSIFTWFNMMEENKYVWRKTDSPHVPIGHCLDIRREGDVLPQEKADLFAPLQLAQASQPVLAGPFDAADWNALHADPSTLIPFSLPPIGQPGSCDESNTSDSLFGDAVELSPPPSPVRPRVLVPQLCLPTAPPLVFPDPPAFDFLSGSGTVAPKDIFSPVYHTLALPPTPAESPVQGTVSLPSKPRAPPVVETKRPLLPHKKEKKYGGWDDSDFEMSEDDASDDGEGGSEFGASTSKGHRHKTGNQRASTSSSSKAPLYCDFPGCSFVQRNGRAVDLMRHSETHKNPEVRPKHVCPDCGHPVSRKDALRRHQEQSCKANGEAMRRPRKKRARKSAPY